ncbi:MAG: hypothetical protein LC799_26985 [Actinobacteria bacterium]|nr:hypothetical protein [Actinomycetota bacterium]MCA1708443.1 hypothetical protein [Actinomycetota bacterium]
MDCCNTSYHSRTTSAPKCPPNRTDPQIERLGQCAGVRNAWSGQVPLDSLDRNPGTSKQRLATRRTPLTLDLPDQGLIALRTLRNSLAQRLQIEHFTKYELIGPQITFPGSVLVLELHTVADRRERELGQRTVGSTSPIRA